MKQDPNTTLTHVYGVIGLITSIGGLILSFKLPSPWSEVALFGSGWIVAVFLAILLIRDFNRARNDGEEIGQLKEGIRGLEKELASRNQTADFLASLLLTNKARPRAGRVAAQASANSPNDDDARGAVNG